MNLTAQDIDTLEEWWVAKSRINFLAYRQYIRSNNFLCNWFIEDLARHLQQFYLDLKANTKPILLVSTPPQHGKSWSILDFISWLSGMLPHLRTVYASYSDTLGIRCNTQLQRYFDSEKFKNIFPDFSIVRSNVVTLSTKAKRNSKLIEYLDAYGNPTDGQFRNTTVAGAITGESLDLGVIDDAFKGREQANSLSQSNKIWDWFTNDFNTRFSENAGLIVTATRWVVHDVIGRILDTTTEEDNIKVVNYPALAIDNELYRKVEEPLFPELKSKEFILKQKRRLIPVHFEALYQGSPTVEGGNIFKDGWWGWWRVLPQLKYTFITADTAQKTNNYNDWTCFHLWGYGEDDKIYLLDKFREKLEAPDLRREAELFYKEHDKKRVVVSDPILRGMYIEDKSSGIGLIQELRRKGLNIFEVARNTDKIARAQDVAPFVQTGKVFLNIDIPGVNNITKEGREFPHSTFDDDIDTLMTAVEVAFINQDSFNLLQAAMEADN